MPRADGAFCGDHSQRKLKGLGIFQGDAGDGVRILPGQLELTGLPVKSVWQVIAASGSASCTANCSLHYRSVECCQSNGQHTVGLISPDQDLCIAHGHSVDCNPQPSHLCESASQQGLPNQV